MILAGATLGAGIALGRREPSSRVRGALFLLACIVGALGITVPAAIGIKSYLSEAVDVRWLLAPVAFAIGLFGATFTKAVQDKAPALTGHIFDRWIARKTGGSDTPGPPP